MRRNSVSALRAAVRAAHLQSAHQTDDLHDRSVHNGHRLADSAVQLDFTVAQRHISIQCPERMVRCVSQLYLHRRSFRPLFPKSHFLAPLHAFFRVHRREGKTQRFLADAHILQGGLDRSRLKGMNKLMISMLTKGLASQKQRTAQEERMLTLLQTDTNYVCAENLNDIQNWFEKEVTYI